MTTQGINFPGHFLLSANGVLIDPLTADAADAAPTSSDWLADANLTHLAPNALAPASPDEMAVRMLNNVKAIYAARGDFVDALALIDCQMPLVGDTGPLQIERAELWFAARRCGRGRRGARRRATHARGYALGSRDRQAAEAARAVSRRSTIH